jgi:hypothetical protein
VGFITDSMERTGWFVEKGFKKERRKEDSLFIREKHVWWGK